MGELHIMDDFDFEDFENKRIRWDYKNLKEGGIDLWTRILLRISPLRGIKRLSRRLGLNQDFADKAHEVFVETTRIDIVPSSSGVRGFQLIINGNTALYFNQDGDHFVYDGFEIGEYEKGEVTIFDGK